MNLLPLFSNSVACGMGHSMVIVDRSNIGDRLEEPRNIATTGSDGEEHDRGQLGSSPQFTSFDWILCHS